MTTPADERVTVGLVRGVHGLRGAVRVEVLSDVPGRFAVGSVLFVDGDTGPLAVVWSGPAKQGVLVRFAGVDSREAAEPLRDRYLEVPGGEPLSADTWYWHQIQGLEVTTTTGDSLGEVADVFRAGEGEVYVVRGGPLGEVLVPAVRSVVVELDPSEGRMVVDPVALDLPDKPPRRRRRQEITRRSRKAARAARAAKAREAAEGRAVAEATGRGVADATDGPQVSDTPSAEDARAAGDAG